MDMEPAGSGRSPWAGGGCRPHSVAAHLCFWLGYLASQSLSFPVRLWGDGSMDWLVIFSEQGRKGSSGNSTEYRQYGNRRPCFPQVCLQDQESKSEQTCSRARGWAQFGGSSCFLNLGRSRRQWAVAGSSHTRKHPDLKAQQPLSPVSGPPGGRRDIPASSSALFLSRTFEIQAIIREKQGWGHPMWEEDMG